VNEELGSNRRRKRSSGRVEWNTPGVVLGCVAKLGPIGVDPCWNERSNVSAEVAFSVDDGDDGLSAIWHTHGGLVYVNPPYGQALKQWVPKMIAEGNAGAEIVALLPNSTETVWFGKLFAACQAAACWRGRLTFDGATTPAFFGSALFYFGHRPYAFADAFSQHAYVIKMAPKGLAA
jgi:hypothetical protein